ncbi:MAG TPA: hypothetical protein PLW86_11180 [Rhodocyclaceae bacterium]|nr:hypothetical protein [Rhodocyclaceae bacterium]
MKALFALTLLAIASLVQAGQLVDVEVIDRNTGQTLETWAHRGKLYVAGTPGNRYAVRVTNKSGGRLLSVISVDGVNAVTGETASPGQSGYVLAAGQRAEIAGWRKSMEEVAAFYFTSITDSYAGRTERPQNVGVIGVAVFREYEPPRLAEHFAEQRAKAASSDAAAPAPSAAGNAKPRSEPASRQAAAEPTLGTGHGERLNARTEYTDFRRASDQPGEIISVYYDSRAKLIARGIIPSPVYSRPAPNPFPGNFVPDPKG